jgi:hypothetical protein
MEGILAKKTHNIVGDFSKEIFWGNRGYDKLVQDAVSGPIRDRIQGLKPVILADK